MCSREKKGRACTFWKPVREKEGEGWPPMSQELQRAGQKVKALHGSGPTSRHGMSPKPEDLVKKQGQEGTETTKGNRRLQCRHNCLRDPHAQRRKHWTPVQRSAEGRACHSPSLAHSGDPGQGARHPRGWTWSPHPHVLPSPLEEAPMNLATPGHRVK